MQMSLPYVCTCPERALTFSRVMYGRDVIYDTISIDISVRRVIGGEGEAAKRSPLIQMHHFHTLM